jgi:FtsP/CotA-like multicopper oxidase with cupredoxin domain
MTRTRFSLPTAFFAALILVPWIVPGASAAPLPGGTQDPTKIPKYVAPLVILPEMPKTSTSENLDEYEIAVRQFTQQILPAGMPKTKVWSYASVTNPDPPNPNNPGGTLNYPAFSIEATAGKNLRVKWINDLKNQNGKFFPHLLPVDQTLHWANPPGGEGGTDMRGMNPTPYLGPVPIVTHVHGSHAYDHSDGFTEAWYLPDANNIPAGFASVGSDYNNFKAKFAAQFPIAPTWPTGAAIFQYANDQRATTLWYHDHSLGMTRLNVYAGPAGFYLIRGGADDLTLGYNRPGLPLGQGVNPGTITEIPIVIQDRSFNSDGSLFYPDNRAFFEGLNVNHLKIPFIPDQSCAGGSDVSPIWNPEFFGNTMVVNGQTWPFLTVEQRRYRLRLLNGGNSRFLNLSLQGFNAAGQPTGEVPIYVIGTDGGFLPNVVKVLTGNYTVNNLPDVPTPVAGTPADQALLMGLAERMDVIVDFSALPAGTATVRMLNTAPDEPFGGFPTSAADPGTTGQVMEFRVVPLVGTDTTTPPQDLTLPAIALLPGSATPRQVSLNEESSSTVFFSFKGKNVVEDCSSPDAFGPTAAKLGTYSAGNPTALKWEDDITETPSADSDETWEIFNFTADAHPIHVHLVQFQVQDRQALDNLDEEGIAVPPAFPTGDTISPEPFERGFKDTVISYPGQVIRINARFDVPTGQALPALYVWHCHILEHEDNEMMRPYLVTGP